MANQRKATRRKKPIRKGLQTKEASHGLTVVVLLRGALIAWSHCHHAFRKISPADRRTPTGTRDEVVVVRAQVRMPCLTWPMKTGKLLLRAVTWQIDEASMKVCVNNHRGLKRAHRQALRPLVVARNDAVQVEKYAEVEEELLETAMVEALCNAETLGVAGHLPEWAAGVAPGQEVDHASSNSSGLET